ncbi:MAG: GDSL-type esterase/lipase family protein [Candidatus Limivicinus sp.]
MRWVTNVAAANFEAIPLPGFQLRDRTLSAEFVSGFDCAGIRFVLGEHYGSAAVHYARAAAAVDGAAVPLTVNGAPCLTIPPGERIVTDPVMLPVCAGGRIRLWLYHSGDRNPATVSLYPQCHSGKGDWCGKAFRPELFSASLGTMQLQEPLHSFCRLEGAVAEGQPAEAIAAFGDSITAMNLWVPRLRRRIRETAAGTVLLNLGISGNRLLRDTSFAGRPGHGQLFGRSGLNRLEWDVLEAPGISTVLLALGGNDIAQPGGNPASSPPAAERCTPEEFLEGCRQVLRRCHENRIRVIGCTITPFGGYLTADAEAMKIRREINRWIQESGEFDGVVDFAGAIADPQNEDFMLAGFDSGDHLHPNKQGGEAMSECVDLKLLF